LFSVDPALNGTGTPENNKKLALRAFRPQKYREAIECFSFAPFAPLPVGVKRRSRHQGPMKFMSMRSEANFIGAVKMKFGFIKTPNNYDFKSILTAYIDPCRLTLFQSNPYIPDPTVSSLTPS